MNVVEFYNQVPVLLVLPPFPHHHFCHLLRHQNFNCSKVGPIIQSVELSCGPPRFDIECTLTWDCVGCVLSQRITCIPSIRMSLFLLPSPFLAVSSLYCSSQTGSLHLWISKPCFLCCFFLTLYLWTFQNCRLLGAEYFWWYVRKILSSVHKALFALAGRRAKLLFPRRKQTVIWVAVSEKLVWTKWWLCETLAKGRSGALTVERSILTWTKKKKTPGLVALLFHLH